MFRGITATDGVCRSSMRTVSCTRYVTPLREGGSVPAIVEADDCGMYVAKFCGAAQGVRALAAEVIAAQLAKHLGLPIPDTALIDLPQQLVTAEPDPELQDLLKASVGLNFAIDYLPGALVYDPAAKRPVSSRLASQVVWFDAWLTNIDRTAKNTNLLWWHGKLWLIDHGASLYIHHTWQDPQRHAEGRFAAIAKHVLLQHASELATAHAALSARIDKAALVAALGEVPDAWLPAHEAFADVHAQRAAYVDYLLHRLSHGGFVEEAQHAYAALV